MREVRTFPESSELEAAAAALVVDAGRRAIAERRRFLLVLAGGSTPRGVYRRLASQHAEQVAWEHVHLFWGDERAVPPDHPESNYRMAAETLLRDLPVPAANVHRIRGEESAARAAMLYSAELQRFFDAPAPHDLRDDEGFDLVILGVGADGHTASLFPGSAALEETGWAAAAQAPESAAIRERITLTLAALGSARETLVLATGQEKREALETVLGAAGAGPPAPAGLATSRGVTHWFLDAEAAPASLRGSR